MANKRPHPICIAIIVSLLLAATTQATGWKNHQVQQLNGRAPRIKLPARFQIATEKWYRIARCPYLIYMPENKRLLMLISCDTPMCPLVMHSDDLGTTWSPPRHIRPNNKPNHVTGVGVSLTYLGNGRAVFATEQGGRYFSDDFGMTWSDPLPKPPSSDGGKWYQWCPYLVDRDPSTNRITRIWETGWNRDRGHVQAYIRSSDDQARTWSPSLAVPQWKLANEVALIRAKTGHLVAACRTEKTEKFKNEWIDHLEGMGISISRDNGKTWSKIDRLYEWGRHHPSMVMLPTGTIVMTHVVRKGYVDAADGFPQFGIEAIVSRDNGQTWDLDHKYLLATWKGNRPKGSKEWWAGCQQTSSALLPDGSLLTAFGTGFRCEPAKKDDPPHAIPRDIALVHWPINEKGLNDDNTIAAAPFDSDLRNVFDPDPNDDFPPELVDFVPYEHNPVFEARGPGHWDAAIRERGWILRESDTYHMWFTGYDGTRPDLKMLGYATSPDGLKWTRHPDNPLYREHWVEDMTVVKHGNTYYMFAEGPRDAHLLVSTDRIHWTRKGPLDIRLTNGKPLSPGPFGTPTVRFENGTWHLFYERRDAGIWLATSKNLIRWTHVQDDPVLLPGPENYDRKAIALNQIIKHAGRYYAYYHGIGQPESAGWCTCVAVSDDLIHWKKYPKNPILRDNQSSGILVHDGTQFRLYTMHDKVRLHLPRKR